MLDQVVRWFTACHRQTALLCLVVQVLRSERVVAGAIFDLGICLSAVANTCAV